ncbi:MAG: type II secretion system minor pseudopilin GspK [Gammaproteobacteria bacterium]|nr:type II secretion system minor pseudopilin GspK [Gammaproteobacteria bacterium]
MMPLHSQKGVALIAAMMVMTIGVTIAANLLWSSNLQMHRTRNLSYMDQAQLYALGAEAWAADTLITDLEESQSDSLDEVWAIALPPLPIDGGQLSGSVEDLQGRFNLNNLVTPSGQKHQAWFDIFVRLLISLEINPQIADAVVDWIDANVDVTFPDGAEDDLYTGLEPAYRTANVFLSDASEIRAINGFDAEIYEALKPYVTALPRGTKINLNTASELVIASLSDEITLFDAQIITENRAGQPFTTLQELESFVPVEALLYAAVDTEYFAIKSVVALGSTQFSMYSLLERDKRSSAVTTRLRRTGYE